MEGVQFIDRSQSQFRNASNRQQILHVHYAAPIGPTSMLTVVIVVEQDAVTLALPQGQSGHNTLSPSTTRHV